MLGLTNNTGTQTGKSSLDPMPANITDYSRA
jgi:hypothetical protein